MDRDFLIELFAGFGPVAIRRMFSGYGVSADGVNFALVLRGSVYLRADEQSIPRFKAEGCGPFRYEVKGGVAHLRGTPPKGEEQNPGYNPHYEITIRK